MAGRMPEIPPTTNAVSSSQKRQEQIKAWERSETNKQPSTVLPSRRVPTVKFGDNVVFFAATHSGDLEEVERLVRQEGADVNFVNKDGLTALHQVSDIEEYCQQ
jgi:ankyrin repeat protein